MTTKGHPESLLFVGLGGRIAALDRATGEEVWRAELPGTGYQVVAVLHHDGRLFAGTAGNIFALDPVNGAILWRNCLEGLAYDAATLAVPLTPPGGSPSPVLYIGTHGYAVAVRCDTGAELWRVSLPSTGFRLVSIIANDVAILVATAGVTFGLSPVDGRIMWENRHKGMGIQDACIGSVTSPAFA